MKVLFSVPIRSEQVECFRKEFPQIEFLVERNQLKSREELLEEIDIWVDYGLELTQEELQRAKNLKWLMVYSAGVDKLPKEEILKRNILVTNVRGIHKHAIAEQVFGYMLYYVRKFDVTFQQQKNKEWNRNFKPQSLYGKTIGILGVGAIGQEIARKAKAFDMKVLGVRKTAKPTPYVDEIYSIEKMDRVLTSSDFIVTVFPNTPETKHIINKEAFNKMQEHVYFINIARGEIVDTQALLWALKKKKIAGAAIDVFEEEPLPKDHPLRSLENIFITPHSAGLFPDYISRANEIFKKNLWTFLTKIGKMINVVDLKKGY
ncbi:D-2-hydroxyacid dehydrogenase [Garciella nitratireducens]|uniref:D-2-hydroxyacid dehydrogenase n=1 Tax=Garciella nitratireducens TaxID=218205 RepID=UPI001BD449B4|nr:D-2-hydroxyacid dehydrogenase [Garciella nitratireducens]